MQLSYEAEAAPAAPVRVASTPPLAFDVAARRPWPSDVAAIATCDLPAGQRLTGPDLVLSEPLLEGHRFLTAPIAAGELVTSWGEPFGRALRPIAAGEWLRNARALSVLRERADCGWVQGIQPNFSDHVKPCEVSEDTFRAGEPLPHSRLDATFDGFVREAGRGVGTRNYLVLLPLSSRASAFSRALGRRLRAEAPKEGGLDGVVAMPHTEDGAAEATAEGGGGGAANNSALLVRTLLGLLLHPNVGAALVLQTEEDVAAAAAGRGVCYADLEQAARAAGREGALRALSHRVSTLRLLAFDAELASCAAQASELLPPLRAATREPCAASSLVVAQQCGGSDAFSGTHANPLVGAASKAVVQAGGTALLAETDELIGAEQYVLQSVADFPTASKFLHMVRRFQAYAAEHNTSAEGNPSGGNLYRGLYNIALKSLGAAMKRPPDVRLEKVVEYSELLPPPKGAVGGVAEGEGGGGDRRHGVGTIGPGFCFMDSPGNDLESIAGQVACGCNLIYFSTGNGSITNFPFVRRRPLRT